MAETAALLAEELFPNVPPLRRPAVAGPRKPATEWTVARACLQLIREFEGFKPRPHFSPADNLPIGYGHMIKPSEEFESITRDRAHELIVGDVEEKAQAVARIIRVPVSRNEFSALMCLVYNIGEGKLRGDSTIRELKILGVRHFETAEALPLALSSRNWVRAPD